ncbi:MAG: outer membrane beta-barrel protein [Gammaproteobacteria bacterium]
MKLSSKMYLALAGLALVLAGGPDGARAAADPEKEVLKAEMKELKERLGQLEQRLEEKDRVAKEEAAAPKEEAASLPDWIDEIELHGFLSLGYVWNFNEPDSDINTQRFFDSRHNAFRVHDFEFSVLKAAADPGSVGFRVDLDVGSDIPRVIHSVGLLENEVDSVTGDVDFEDFDVRQAFASYNAPLGKGLTIDIGKFITHFGLEVIEGWPGYNDNYSRSYDFAFAIPFTHTGIRATYPVNDKLSLMAMVVNGWDQVDDINGQKGYGGQIGFFPMEGMSFYFNYLGSPEQSDQDSDWRHLFGLTWVVKPLPTALPDFTLSGTYDYGYEENLGGDDVEWSAAQGVLRYDFTPWFYLALRGEWMDDEDGVRIIPCLAGAGCDGFLSGYSGQVVWALTLTPTFKIGDHLVVRPEFRYDDSNQEVFEDEGDDTKNSQTTVGLNVIYSY